MAAIIRINEKTKYIVVLCPMGHVLTSRKMDTSFGGSAFEADMAFRGPGNLFDRLAAECTGAGH